MGEFSVSFSAVKPPNKLSKIPQNIGSRLKQSSRKSEILNRKYAEVYSKIPRKEITNQLSELCIEKDLTVIKEEEGS
jgi:hypothetical protein